MIESALTALALTTIACAIVAATAATIAFVSGCTLVVCVCGCLMLAPLALWQSGAWLSEVLDEWSRGR